jgi:hypothetical protein
LLMQTTQNREAMRHKPISDSDAIRLSIDRAIKSAAGAQTVLAVLAFVAPDRIPTELLHEGFMNSVERSEAIAALCEYSLVTLEREEDGTSYLGIHREVQQLMHARLQICGAATEAAAVATLLLAFAFPIPDDHRNLSTCSQLLPHALAVLERSPDMIVEFDDNGWLSYRKHQLQQRVARYRWHLDDAELLRAFMDRQSDLRASEIVAKGIDQFRPDVKRRLVREAFELSGNPHLQPIREIFRLQPEAFQREISVALDRSCELMKSCRELMVQHATEQISKLVSERLDQFPLHLQNQLQRAYGSPNGKDKSFFERYQQLQSEAQARFELRSLLGIPEP